MYKIVIADDEEIIRNTLTGCFKRDIYVGFEVFEASDGEDALETVKQVKPNIIITDIKMPVIDGLELSSIIKQMFPDIVIIVLSGFNEFSLVRNALNIGVFDYLLKPIKEEELDAVVKKAVELVERQNYKKIQENIIKQKICAGDLAIKENFLNSLIINSYGKNDGVYSKVNNLKFNIDFSNFFVIVFSMKEESVEKCINKGFDVELLKFSVSNIIEECCKEYLESYELFTTIDNKFVLVIDKLAYNSNESVQILDVIKTCVDHFLKVGIVAGVSKNYDGVSSLKKAYDEACEKVELKLFLGKDEVDCENDDAEKISSSIVEQNKKLFVNSIYLCDMDKTFEAVNDMLLHVESMQLSLKHLKYFKMHIINCIVDIARNLDCDIDLLAGGDKSIYERADEYKSIEAFNDFLKDIIHPLIEIIKKRNSNKKKKTIESILKYIDENYSTDLTLVSISEKFYIDYTNLSKMFKEDVGKLFSKYLIDIRIKKAKELLTLSHKKIYEIGEEVGYTDIKHFTKVFKELEGMTPMEYRKSKGILRIEKGEAEE